LHDLQWVIVCGLAEHSSTILTGGSIIQITLNSQLAAAVTIKSANLLLQPGFAHVNNHEGQPTPAWLLPLSVSASSECALLFAIRSEPVTAKDGEYERLALFQGVTYCLQERSISKNVHLINRSSRIKVTFMIDSAKCKY